VHWVVTEYGAVNLFGLSLRQRGEALISIAHPDFRAELGRELAATRRYVL
jgi:acyl-CoA hydrolase